MNTMKYVDGVQWAVDNGYLFVKYVDLEQDEYWHASKGKNTSHLFAISELQKITDLRSICLVNLDADNILSD